MDRPDIMFSMVPAIQALEPYSAGFKGLPSLLLSSSYTATTWFQRKHFLAELAARVKLK